MFHKFGFLAELGFFSFLLNISISHSHSPELHMQKVTVGLSPEVPMEVKHNKITGGNEVMSSPRSSVSYLRNQNETLPLKT